MQLIIDTHVHIHSCYEPGAFFRSLLRNLAALAPGAVRAAVLTERAGADVYAQLASGRCVPGEGVTVAPVPGRGVLEVSTEDEGQCFLLPGRQVNTCERLEVLALFTEAAFADGLSVQETIDAVLSAGGVPVVAWSPGKWFFRRGRMVRSVLAHFELGQVALGDTSLRPTVWPEPGVMRQGRRRGVPVLAGTDPLPVVTDVSCPGTYASLLEMPVDFELSSQWMHSALPRLPSQRVGRRNGPVRFARRWLGNALAGRLATR